MDLDSDVWRKEQKYLIEVLKSGGHFVVVIVNRQDLCKNPTSAVRCAHTSLSPISLLLAARFKKGMRLQKDMKDFLAYTVKKDLGWPSWNFKRVHNG